MATVTRKHPIAHDLLFLLIDGAYDPIDRSLAGPGLAPANRAGGVECRRSTRWIPSGIVCSEPEEARRSSSSGLRRDLIRRRPDVFDPAACDWGSPAMHGIPSFAFRLVRRGREGAGQKSSRSPPWLTSPMPA